MDNRDKSIAAAIGLGALAALSFMFSRRTTDLKSEEDSIAQFSKTVDEHNRRVLAHNERIESLRKDAQDATKANVDNLSKVDTEDSGLTTSEEFREFVEAQSIKSEDLKKQYDELKAEHEEKKASEYFKAQEKYIKDASCEFNPIDDEDKEYAEEETSFVKNLLNSYKTQNVRQTLEFTELAKKFADAKTKWFTRPLIINPYIIKTPGSKSNNDSLTLTPEFVAYFENLAKLDNRYYSPINEIMDISAKRDLRLHIMNLPWSNSWRASKEITEDETTQD